MHPAFRGWGDQIVADGSGRPSLIIKIREHSRSIRRAAYRAPVREYVYELRRGNEVLATGQLSIADEYEVGDDVEVAGWFGIVRDVQPQPGSGVDRLIVQVKRPGG